jgi:hypothetical protein
MKPALLLLATVFLAAFAWGQDSHCTHDDDNIVDRTTCVFSDGSAVVSSYYHASEQSFTEHFTPSQWRTRVAKAKRAQAAHDAERKALDKAQAAADAKMSVFKSRAECESAGGEWRVLMDGATCEAKAIQ